MSDEKKIREFILSEERIVINVSFGTALPYRSVIYGHAILYTCHAGELMRIVKYSRTRTRNSASNPTKTSWLGGQKLGHISPNQQTYSRLRRRKA